MYFCVYSDVLFVCVGMYFDVQEITPYAIGVSRFDAADKSVSDNSKM